MSDEVLSNSIEIRDPEIDAESGICQLNRNAVISAAAGQPGAKGTPHVRNVWISTEIVSVN